MPRHRTLRLTRTQNPVGLWLTIGAIATILCFFCIVAFFPSPSPSELCEIGEPITTAIKTYYQEYGRYPLSLDDAGILASDTYFGPWEYDVSSDGSSCSLANGNYARDNFEVSWTPKGGWYIDT